MRTISFLAADGTVNQSTFNHDGTPTWEEDYTFDPTGNWGNYLTKVAGSTTLNQNRTHNKDNALLTVAGSSALVAVNSVGNMTTAPVPGNWAAGCYQVYDAWNRLVSVSEDSWDSVDSEEEFGVVGTYAYDGLSRRVTKVSGSVSVTRHYYYTAPWQIAEERVGSATTEDRQLVWGLRGLDDLVLRDVGTVRLYAMHDYFNCTAVTNPGGGGDGAVWV